MTKKRYLFLLLTAIFLGFCGKRLPAQNASLPANPMGWQLVRTVDGGDSPSGKFRDAVALDVDSEGNLFVVDRGRYRVVKFDKHGFFRQEIGGFGRGADQFGDPVDIDAHHTLNIFVADYSNNRIARFDANLNYLSELTSREGQYYFEMPLSVAVSGQYDIFLLEDLNKRVIKFDRFNNPQGTFGNNTESLGQLLGPQQLALGENGAVFVSDPIKNKVVVFDYLGNFLRELSHPAFRYPRGISVNSRNDLSVADSEAEMLFFFRGGETATGTFDLREYQIFPQDVVWWRPRGISEELLYVLSSEKCLVFARK